MNARFYDPVVGRFMGYDPAPVTPTNLFSFNRYAYANNNPMRYTDPNGLSPFDFELTAPIGAVIGGIEGYHEAGFWGAIVGAVTGALSAAATTPFQSVEAVSATITVMGLNTATSVASVAAVNSVKSGKFNINDFNSSLSFSNAVMSFGGAGFGSYADSRFTNGISRISSPETNLFSHALKTTATTVAKGYFAEQASTSVASLTDKTTTAANNAANSNAARQVGAMEGAKSQAPGMGAAASHSSGNSNGGNGANAGGDTHSGGGWF